MALRIGLGLGLSGGVSFSPLSLFAASEPGLWYDFGDLSTLFQDTAGTTPVTAAGQSVARINDKSGRGNHATQSTSLSRPTLGRNPASGTRNLLTYTEQFDNAAWTKTGCAVSPDATTALDNILTADKITEDTSTGTHRVVPATSPTIVSGLAYTATVYAKAAERTQIRLVENDTTGAFASFDILNGTVLSSGSGGTGVITSVGNGWYRCELRFTSAGTLGRIDIALSNAGSIGYSGVAGSGAFIWGAQLELGSTATAYQKVVSAFDVTEAGKADCWYLGFDGSDDFLVTPTITPGTDKAQVFAGVRKLSDAARGTVAELTASAASNNGAWHLAAPNAASATFAFESKGTALTDAIASSGVAAPVTAVVTGIADIGADTNIIRINGTQADSDSGDQGTGNFTAAAVYVGRRGGTSLPANIRLYQLIGRFGPNLTADQIAQTEAWVNSKTGAY